MERDCSITAAFMAAALFHCFGRFELVIKTGCFSCGLVSQYLFARPESFFERRSFLRRVFREVAVCLPGESFYFTIPAIVAYSFSGQFRPAVSDHDPCFFVVG